ncbi:prealbumin-like fold domain-containing protein [Dactylosporangium sp. CA-139066]|uniref:prealbumin-like fold domain-containing protein n=1 Tax=Dactylosporangium sp. CA-139066 TaxID=3239930 RepID=UPI003D8A0870
MLVLAPAVSASAREGESPASVSASLHYQVTFVARACDSYHDVMGNRVRDDHAESAALTGRETAYQDGSEVDPDVEAANSSGCEPLNGWQFSLGAGHEKKGALSTVTAPATGSGPTAAAAPLLDRTGQKTDKTIDGAVTVILTDDQARAAARHQLWAQGGTPGDPLMTGAQSGRAGYGFGALRCALDDHTGGNVQWIGFPAGTRHVFCFAYYVKGAPAPGTLIVRARTTRAPGYPQRFAFDASPSYNRDQRISVDTSTDATFVRSSGGQPSTIASRTPPGWTLADLGCTKSGAGQSLATTDVPTGRATVTLAPGEIVTCTFTYAPPAVPPGLTLLLYSDSPGGAFNLSVADPAGGPPRLLSATPTGDGSASTAAGADLGTLLPGSYAVTLTPPAGDAAAWSLAGAACGDQTLKPDNMTVTVVVPAGAAIDCAVRVSRKAGSLELRSVTVGGTAAASFAVTPRAEALAGWSGVATTTGVGIGAVAQGDVPGSLAFGDYLVTPVPPVSTVDGSWRLSSFACDPGDNPDMPDVAADVAHLSAGRPAAKCTATFLFDPARQLQVTVRFAGNVDGRAGAVVLDVQCEDGSSGRAVLAAEDNSEASLPAPLGFLSPTRCMVQRPTAPAAKSAQVSVTATLDPNPGKGPLAIPGTVEIAADNAADEPEYTVVVTVTFDTSEAPPTQQKVLDTFKVLPVALIGAGLVGLGLLILLIMVLRSRAD